MKAKESPVSKSSRIQRETKTIEVMIRKFCHLNHKGQSTPCQECSQLLVYAKKRLASCPFQERKTTCSQCPIHCYQPAMRQKIQKVMKTIGPKMIFSHPLLGLAHILDGLRKKPGAPHSQNHD